MGSPLMGLIWALVENPHKGQKGSPSPWGHLPLVGVQLDSYKWSVRPPWS